MTKHIYSPQNQRWQLLGETNKKKIMAFIVSFKNKHDGNSPSIGEIKDACNISSKSLVSSYLDQLEREKVIKLERAIDGKSYIARMIKVIGARWNAPRRKK